MPGTFSTKYYVNIDLNHNELQNAIAGSGSYLYRPIPNGLEDKGLFYYDQYINHLMIWNGYTWKISKYLDDGTYTSTDNILLENIWTQTDLIPVDPVSLSASIVTGITDIITLTLSHVTSSYTFTDYTDQLKDIVPTKYGSVYIPSVYDNNSVLLPTNFQNYKVEGNDLTFYDGFTFSPNLIGPTQSPSISFVKYIGTKGAFTFNTGDLTNINISSVTPPYDVISYPFIYTATPSNTNTLLFINGVSEYAWTFSTTASTITIFTASLQYDIESDDVINIHYKG